MIFQAWRETKPNAFKHTVYYNGLLNKYWNVSKTNRIIINQSFWEWH